MTSLILLILLLYKYTRANLAHFFVIYSPKHFFFVKEVCILFYLMCDIPYILRLVHKTGKRTLSQNKHESLILETKFKKKVLSAKST